MTRLTSLTQQTFYELSKIDDVATDGLTGTHDSLAYRVEEIERHFHVRERWWGALAVPDETNAIEANVARPFVAISDNNAWGAAIPLIGTADEPTASATDAYFDLHRMEIVTADNADVWRVRFIYGTGTSAAAIGAGQWTEVMVQLDPGPPVQAIPAVEIRMPREAAGTKVWAQVWSATNLDTISFFIGVHGYEG